MEMGIGCDPTLLVVSGQHSQTDIHSTLFDGRKVYCLMFMSCDLSSSQLESGFMRKIYAHCCDYKLELLLTFIWP